MPYSRIVSIALVLLWVFAYPLCAEDFQPPDGFTALSEDEIRQLFTGNTVDGSGRGGEEWREYYTAAGEILGSTGDGKEYLRPNYWSVERSMVCFDYRADEYDMCSNIAVDTSEQIFFFDPQSGEIQGRARILPGNQLE